MLERELSRLIARKRDGGALSPMTWQGVVKGFLDGSIPDAPMAALLMACVWRDLNLEETVALTSAMVDSGETLHYTSGPVVDKHSSGGVGDTVSLLAVPLAAAAGARVAKLSGRALGHTGGTLDKLEALPGVEVAMPLERFMEIIERVGCSISAQTATIVPADRKIYALRDATATIPSVGLIAASIVSKKIAAGADAIVYDIKVGNGAFMQDLASARELADRILAVTQAFGKRGTAFITEMDAPLGTVIGSGLEALEALALLGGRTAAGSRLAELAVIIADEMCSISGFAPRAGEMLGSGAGAAKMLEMLAAQGGRIHEFAALAPCEPTTQLSADQSGYVEKIDATAMGNLSRELIERSGNFAGIELLTTIGAAINVGAPLMRVHGMLDAADGERLRGLITIGAVRPAIPPLVYDRRE